MSTRYEQQDGHPGTSGKEHQRSAYKDAVERQYAYWIRRVIIRCDTATPYELSARPASMQPFPKIVRRGDR